MQTTQSETKDLGTSGIMEEKRPLLPQVAPRPNYRSDTETQTIPIKDKTEEDHTEESGMPDEIGAVDPLSERPK